MEYGQAYSGRFESRHQMIELFALSALGFLIPFSFGHPQLLVGVLVNALIIRAAMTLPLNRALPIAFTPTLGVLARGLLFGPFTIFVVYLLPFICVGNILLLWAFSKGGNFGFTLAASSVVKAAFLYSSAYVLFVLGIIPAVLLPAMGVLQLTTALAGGIIAVSEFKLQRLFL
jgi:hypothetical protein